MRSAKRNAWSRRLSTESGLCLRISVSRRRRAFLLPFFRKRKGNDGTREKENDGSAGSAVGKGKAPRGADGLSRRRGGSGAGNGPFVRMEGGCVRRRDFSRAWRVGRRVLSQTPRRSLTERLQRGAAENERGAGKWIQISRRLCGRGGQRANGTGRSFRDAADRGASF